MLRECCSAKRRQTTKPTIEFLQKRIQTRVYTTASIKWSRQEKTIHKRNINWFGTCSPNTTLIVQSNFFENVLATFENVLPSHYKIIKQVLDTDNFENPKISLSERLAYTPSSFLSDSSKLCGQISSKPKWWFTRAFKNDNQMNKSQLNN